MYALWARATASASYRHSVEAPPDSQSIPGKVVTVSVVWTNYGSAAAFERWTPVYRLVDSSGAVARTPPAKVGLKTLVHDDLGQPCAQPVPGIRHRVGAHRPDRAWRLGTTTLRASATGVTISGRIRSQTLNI